MVVPTMTVQEKETDSFFSRSKESILSSVSGNLELVIVKFSMHAYKFVRKIGYGSS